MFCLFDHSVWMSIDGVIEFLFIFDRLTFVFFSLWHGDFFFIFQSFVSRTAWSGPRADLSPETCPSKTVKKEGTHHYAKLFPVINSIRCRCYPVRNNRVLTKEKREKEKKTGHRKKEKLKKVIKRVEATAHRHP